MDEGGVEDGCGRLDRFGDVDCYLVGDEDGYFVGDGDGDGFGALSGAGGERYGWDDELCHSRIGWSDWLGIWKATRGSLRRSRGARDVRELREGPK